MARAAVVVCLLAGCGGPTDISSMTEESTASAVIQTGDAPTGTTYLDNRSSTSATATTTIPQKTSNDTKKPTLAESTTTQSTSAATAAPQKTSTATQNTSAPSRTTTSTTAPPTSTTADPNRVTVNGKEYAVGDILSYTVMVKTAQPYGTVKIGLRYVQKGLTVPQASMPIKQMNYVMQNLGIGNWGTGPEDTVSTNGFAMTSNKGRNIDTAREGYAGLLLFFETNDRENGVSKNIDCSKGVALFTAQLKITKPGEYIVDCMEYASNPRADLAVWGEITGVTST